MLAGVALAALMWIVVAAAALRIYRRLGRLEPLPAGDPAPGPPPRVSIVVPARDEEASVERAVRSLLAQQDADLEVVVVNDGSVDGTRAILERLAREDARLLLLHDPPLPEGWLGKVNALHRGVARTRGDWLLFADADVVHHPRALASALALARREDKDLVALLPRFEWEGVVEHGLVVAFLLVLVQLGSSRLEDPGAPDEGLGSGSFTLVRRGAYERAGGHVPLRATVLDDIELGRLVKRAGGRIAVRLAPSLLRLRMYRGAREAFWGLSKNMVVSLGGRPLPAAAIGLAVAWMLLAPPAGALAGALLGDAALAAAGAGVYLLQLATLASLRGWQRFRWSRLPVFPLFAVVAAACIGAGVRRARRGVAVWRGRSVGVEPPAPPVGVGRGAAGRGRG